jgi:uncharacterized protein (TIGR02268 family)
LLTGTTAAAQPPPLVREPRQRQIFVPNSPEEPVPEVRLAADVLTLFVFDAPIERGSVEVEGRATRFRLVDPGESTLTLQLAVELGAEEKLRVRVRYKDGDTPAYATFFLVSHPSVVDKEVVVRRSRTQEALEAALKEKEAELAALKAVSGPAGLAFSGRLDARGVEARRIEGPVGTQNGLNVVKGTGYRASSWALAVLRVQNLPGQQPWEPGGARLTRADGTFVKVLSVDMNKARLGPGEEGLVTVETEAPNWKAGTALHLELRDKTGGRRLLIPKVKL